MERHQIAQVHVADRGAQGHRPQRQVVEAQVQVAQLRDGLQGFRLGQSLMEIVRQQFMGAALPFTRDGEQPQFGFVTRAARSVRVCCSAGVKEACGALSSRHSVPMTWPSGVMSGTPA